MAFEKNMLLFGADPTPRIVAIGLGDTGTVKIYRREEDGGTSCDVKEFHPFVWLDSDVTDLGIDAEKLEGDLRYGWRISLNSWKELIALRNGLKNAGRSFFALSDPIQHYLTDTGRTLFKNLPFEQLKRLQLEVLSFIGGETDIPDSSQPSDHIMSIAISDNTGWEELIMVDPAHVEESERAALKRLTSVIKERDPDVIEGHNLFKFDLPYIVARAGKAKTKLDWGRSGGFLRSRPSRLQIAEKTIDYPKFTVDGRHFVDTFLLVPAGEKPGCAFIGIAKIFAQNAGGIGEVHHVIAKEKIVLDNVPDEAAEKRDVAAGTDRHPDIGQRAGARKSWIDMNNGRAALLCFHDPAEADRMAFGHGGPLD